MRFCLRYNYLSMISDTDLIFLNIDSLYVHRGMHEALFLESEVFYHYQFTKNVRNRPQRNDKNHCVHNGTMDKNGTCNSFQSVRIRTKCKDQNYVRT